jgi:hypothetical protein
MKKKEFVMEVFILMGGIDYEGEALLGVYASEEEAIIARNIYTRDRDMGFHHYYVQRRVLGAPAVADFDDRRFVDRRYV